MTLAGIKKGDVIEADIMGQRFLAWVTSDGAIHDEFRKKRGLVIRPATPRVTHTFATAQQVVGHYRKSAATPLKV